MSDPFEILAIAPTLVAGEVKLAYFAALKRCPPHADPAGFRRIRTAYEELSQPGALAWAFVRSPRSSAIALDGYERRYREALEKARAQGLSEGANAELVARFVAKFSRLTIDEAVAAAATPQ